MCLNREYNSIKVQFEIIHIIIITPIKIMNTDVLRQLIHHWLDDVRLSNTFTNVWKSAESLYDNFILNTKLYTKEDIKYTIFIRKLNNIQSYSGYIYMKVNHSRSGDRTFLYLVNREINSSSFDAILHSPPRL